MYSIYKCTNVEKGTTLTMFGIQENYYQIQLSFLILKLLIKQFTVHTKTCIKCS